MLFHSKGFRAENQWTFLIVLCYIEKGETLESLDIEEYKKICGLFEDDVYEKIDLQNCVSERKSYGGPSPENVCEQVRKVLEIIKQ